MKEWLKKMNSVGWILPAFVVAAGVAFTLSDYTAPVYEVQAAVDGQASDETPEDKTAEQAKGNFDLADGFYMGTGVGFAGNIKVSVEIRDKSIVGIDILEVEADDEAFFNRAKGVIERILQSQSLDVDVVSGATYSSRGIINAVKNALTGEEDQSTTASSGAASGSGGSLSVSTVQDADGYRDGTYYGSGTGFAGTVTVKVFISGGKIASIDVTSHSDGTSYMNQASALLASILATQSTNVDTVSGATYSSVGLIEAVRNALAQAAISSTGNGAQTPNENSGDDASAVPTGKIPYLDGIYYGTAEGYMGDITVAVVIQDKTIKAILITEADGEDEAYLNRAKTLVANVLKTQSTDVDLISGATYSSRGILEAIKAALAEADKVTNGGADEPVTPDHPDDSDNPDTPDTPDAPDNPDNPPDNEGTIYRNGTYLCIAACVPDEDEDFEPYDLQMNVTIENDRIVAITDIVGIGDAYDSANDSYIQRAANGTSRAIGVVPQILEKGLPEDIDVVSRATCSSNSIIEACRKALEEAKLIVEDANK